jgi:putative restriction endonuclease
MGKYSALRRQLEREAGRSVEMAFGELDDLVGGLPASARRHSAWWSNEREGTHVQAHAWLEAGWRVEDVNLTAERVRFTRSERAAGAVRPRD